MIHLWKKIAAGTAALAVVVAVVAVPASAAVTLPSLPADQCVVDDAGVLSESTTAYMNELNGKVLKVNLARPMKTPLQLGGNRAGKPISLLVYFNLRCISLGIRRMAQATCKTAGQEWRYVFPQLLAGGSEHKYHSNDRCRASRPARRLRRSCGRLRAGGRRQQ